MMDFVNKLAAWSVMAIWLFGAGLILLRLVNLASNEAWRVYKNAHGWLTVRTAMREYHERRQK